MAWCGNVSSGTFLANCIAMLLKAQRHSHCTMHLLASINTILFYYWPYIPISYKHCICIIVISNNIHNIGAYS